MIKKIKHSIICYQGILSRYKKERYACVDFDITYIEFPLCDMDWDKPWKLSVCKVRQQHCSQIYHMAYISFLEFLV